MSRSKENRGESYIQNDTPAHHNTQALDSQVLTQASAQKILSANLPNHHDTAHALSHADALSASPNRRPHDRDIAVNWKAGAVNCKVPNKGAFACLLGRLFHAVIAPHAPPLSLHLTFPLATGQSSGLMGVIAMLP